MPRSPLTRRPSLLAVALTIGTLAVTVASGAATAPPAPPAAGPASGVSADQPATPAHTFDLQAHRGGIGLTVENTIASLSRALDLGVSTLELDVQITRDGFPVVTHDRDPNPAKCHDTAPAYPGDPQYPYVPGTTYIAHLTLAQVRTIDCGSLAQPQFPSQQTAPGARMPLLGDVFDLVRDRHAWQVRLNVETKVEADAPAQTASREQFVQVVAQTVREHSMLQQVSVQSFDWGALMRMRQLEPRLPLVALTNGQPFLQAGLPGASPWLGGIDIDDFGGDPVHAVASFGADALSPVHGEPGDGQITDLGYRSYTTAQMVREARADGIKIIPWTVDDVATMHHLLDLGVDGIITNYPDRLRAVLAARGYPLPRAYPAAQG